MPPDEINVALRSTAGLIANSNLVSTALSDASAKLQEYQAKLESGRQQKREKSFARAEKTFISLLDTDAPPELHRTALLELALLAQEEQHLLKAQQVFAQYVEKYQDDPSVPEILLRQGLIYRQMGAPMMALSKFYSVMTTSLRLKAERLDYYERLVLQAQTEIADTYYLQGKSAEAADYLGRLLKLDSPQLNKAQILFKLVRSLSILGRYNDVLAQAELFVGQYPRASELPEVRFLLAVALKKLGRNQEAMQQVLALLESQQSTAEHNPENWVYWQQRTGNEIANQLYREGDHVNALEIYRNLAESNTSTAWQVPAWYQMGLVYERLQQPQKAAEAYTRILERQTKEFVALSPQKPPSPVVPAMPGDGGLGGEGAKRLGAEKLSPSLRAVFDMAKWRKDHLQWQAHAEQTSARLGVSEQPKPGIPLSVQ